MIFLFNNYYFKENQIKLLTDKNACIKSAFIMANGLSLITNVCCSQSFSEVIKFPNHDFFVSSGDESGVKPSKP